MNLAVMALPEPVRSDGCNLCNPGEVRENRFHYQGIGRLA